MDLTLFNKQLSGTSLAKIERRKAENEARKQMLDIPQVQAKLTTSEMILAVACTEKKIREFEDKELVGTVGTMSKFVARDAGIMMWDSSEMQYDYTRFFTMLKNYYSELSIVEVKKAFEMAMVGELDEYLPKDKNGLPDKNHYQRFSVEYYTKILNAYKKKKADVWHKVRNALPPKEIVITEEQKKYLRQETINEIYDAYISYQKTKIVNFPISIYLEVLQELGHIKENPEPTNEDYQKAYRIVLLSDMPRDEKKRLKDEYNKPGGMPLTIKLDAQRIANNRAISYVFDNWIERGFDIVDKEQNEKQL